MFSAVLWFVDLGKRVAKKRGTLERIEMNRRLSREEGKSIDGKTSSTSDSFALMIRLR